jgi:phage/plasmid-like protein (TIGR03299 family)
MSRTATWTKVGHSVEDCRDLREVLRDSGLDYGVVKEPVYIHPDDETSIMVPDRYVTCREDDGHIYDIVSDKYEIIQNEDAFDFVNYMGDEVTFERAGETAGGMVFIIGSLPSVDILGDKFTPYVIFRNGFSGKITTSAAICPLRIVCQNQFNFAFKDTQNAISIRHVSNAEIKMQEARETLRMSADYMQKVNMIAEGYAGTKLTEFQVRQVLEALFPLDKSEDMNPFQRKSLMDAKTAFVKAYETDDNYNFRGSAWGMINAYTDFITHKDPAGNKETRFEGKFIQTTFKPSMNKIIDVIDAIAA